MSVGLPRLIAAEIDSYDQVLQRAIKAEQELAAAEAENKRVRNLAAAVVALQPADPDTGDRAVSLFALMEALDGES